MFELIAAAIIASLSMFVPGILLTFALLRKTELQTFEIAALGIAFGLLAPATLTWLESYLIDYINLFSFSLPLFEINALALTIVGAALCYRDGAFADLSKFLKRMMGQHSGEEPQHGRKKTNWWVWAVLATLMLITFLTRMQSIVVAPKFYEFDPYFDMVDSQYILTYGHQLLLDPSAWPIVAAGTNHRIQPIVPYLEAYWYSLVNTLGPALFDFQHFSESSHRGRCTLR